MKKSILKIGLDPLLHFESIARSKSLKRAADELHLSQPAITQALKKLEANLGVQLCVRSRAGFVLTAAGQRLFQLSKELKDDLKSYENFLTENNEFNGILSVGVIDNFQNKALEQAIKQTILTFPKMKLSIQVHTAQEIQNLASIGEIDIGLGIFNSKLNQLTYRQIGEETIGHYISESHALWNKREIKTDDLKDQIKTWVDIISRDRLALDAEVFTNKKQIPPFASYANNLNAAVLILQSGTSIVPFPAEYLESRKLSFKYKSLNALFPRYSLKQEVAIRREFMNASPAARFLLERLPKFAPKFTKE